MSFLKLIILIIFLLIPSVALSQPERDTGIALFKKGDYKKAIPALKRSTKSDSDGLANYYLGMSYLQLNKLKEASEALEKSVALRPGIAAYKVALGYAYLRRNDRRTRPIVLEALKLEPKNPEAHLILASQSLHVGAYESAYESASKALDANPKLALAYRVRSEALIASFTLLGGVITRPKISKNELLFEAADNMQKYVDLAPAGDDTTYYREYLDSLKFFSDYYRRRQAKLEAAGGVQPSPDASNSTPYKVTYQPKATYTNAARSANVSGAVRLLIGLGADGKISHILVLKPLGFGLDQEAVRAARQIKFEPATENGQRVASVITREYTFTIY